MATAREIEVAQEILHIGIQVNMQGKYHAFVEYAGHVNGISCYLRPASKGKVLDCIKEWDVYSDCVAYFYDRSKLLEGEDDDDSWHFEQLTKLRDRLKSMIDVDADGVPV